MIFEGMEESGSVNLDKFIESEKDKFFAGQDCMCISGELFLGFLEEALLAHTVRQLLARHQDPMLDLRTAGNRLL
jgi:hypothetical protein